MADGFSVDIGALQKAADGVNGTLAQVSASKVSDISCDGGAIGFGKLTETLSDFLSRWQRGVDNLASDGKQIADRLSTNLKSYQAAEQGVADQFDRINDQLSGSGTDPGVH